MPMKLFLFVWFTVFFGWQLPSKVIAAGCKTGRQPVSFALFSTSVSPQAVSLLYLVCKAKSASSLVRWETSKENCDLAGKYSGDFLVFCLLALLLCTQYSSMSWELRIFIALKQSIVFMNHKAEVYSPMAIAKQFR